MSEYSESELVQIINDLIKYGEFVDMPTPAEMQYIHNCISPQLYTGYPVADGIYVEHKYSLYYDIHYYIHKNNSQLDISFKSKSKDKPPVSIEYRIRQVRYGKAPAPAPA